MIRVMIVDDHDLVRVGIKSLLSDIHDIHVVDEADSGQAAIAMARQLQPNVVLMDINMPGVDGLEATRRIVKSNPDIKVLAVTVYGDEPYPSIVLQAGAMGYITKGASLEEMLQAIRTVAKGVRYISPEVAQQLALKHLNNQDKSPLEMLSEREIQVMIMISNGQSVAEIANQLCISKKTVNTYRYRLFEKLEVNSDVELTLMAIRYKLVEPATDSETV